MIKTYQFFFATVCIPEWNETAYRVDRKPSRSVALGIQQSSVVGRKVFYVSMDFNCILQCTPTETKVS